jgi:RNA polymerase sigma-70 factor, ECF subfamily
MSNAAFDALYREHYHRVLGLCRRMLGSAHDAEEAAQEVFMRGYKAFGSYRSREPFGPWIGAVASNYCIDVLRRGRRAAAIFSDESGEAPDPADPAENGAMPLISAHRADAVSRAVEALPDRYRLPIVLAYYADASYEEIADTLNINPNHVGVLLLRGKDRLRRDLAHLVEEN